MSADIPSPPPYSGRRQVWPRQLAAVTVKLAVTAALLWWVFSKIDPLDALQRILEARPLPLACAVFLTLTVPVVLATRWWGLAQPIISRREALSYTWIGLFYGMILPGGVSGDVAKGSLLAWHNDQTRQVGLPASILADRILGFTVLLLFFSISCLLLILNPRGSVDLERFLWPALAGGLAGLAVLVFGWLPAGQRLLTLISRLIPLPVLRAPIDRFLSNTFAYSKRPKVLRRALWLSVGGHGISALMQLFLLSALQIDLDPVAAFTLYSVFSVLGMVPVSIAGIGLRDWFAIKFFAAYGLMIEAGVAFTWLCLCMSLLQAIVGALWQLRIFLARSPAQITPERLSR